MRSLRLLAFAALAFAAACSNDVNSPTAIPEQTPEAAAANIPNPLFQLNFMPTSAFFQVPNENEIPANPAKIVIYSPYAAFATLGPPRVAKVEYTGPGGWLSGNVELKSAFQADLNLRVVKGMPIGAYGARITLTLLGVVNYIVNVTFVSGVYFIDCANSTTGWTFSGLWHLTSGGTSVNPRGPHPGPDEGTGFFGYYSEATGNFNFGNNSGSAVGPAFALPAAAINPVIKARTWFEIEYDVSPFSYDFMEFWLQEDGNPGNRVFVGRINGSPFFAGNGRSFVLPNPWTDVQFAIPSTAFGKVWHLELYFASRDGLYNDYRGWGVDCMSIIENTAPTGPSLGAAARRAIDPQSLIPGSQIPLVDRAAKRAP
jgi:hypothetical protein